MLGARRCGLRIAEPCATGKSEATVERTVQEDG